MGFAGAASAEAGTGAVEAVRNAVVLPTPGQRRSGRPPLERRSTPRERPSTCGRTSTGQVC
ncbi:MAG: hypothetical protein ACO2PN_18860 [Pyrobaculum sp.]